MNLILQRVRSARARLALGEGLLWFARGLFWAGLAAAVFLPFGRWTGWTPAFLWPALGAALLLFSFGMALARRPSLRSAAIALDREAGLEDRLAAALFVLRDDTPVAGALRRNAEDALRRAGRIRVPLPRLPLRRLGLPLALVIAAIAVPLPTGRSKDPVRQTPASLQTILPEPLRKEESEKLRRRAFSLEKQARELGRPDFQELAEAMRKTAEELRKEELTRNEALVKLSSLEEKSRGKKDSIAARLPESLLKRMKGASGDLPKAAELKKAELSKKLSDMAAAAAKLKEKLDQGALSPEQQAALNRDLEKLSSELGKELGSGELGDLQSRLDRLLGQGDARDRGELGKALGDLKNSLDDLELLSMLDGELEEILAAKDEFSDAEGTCRFCGKSMHGQKGGT